MTRVVLLHPLGARAEFWNDVVSRLRPRTHTLALDLPGHGAAPLPRRGATLEHWAAAVLRRIDAVTREKVVLVGVSLGGLLAQYLAATASDRIAGIVLSNTVATYPEDLRRAWVARAAIARNEGMRPLIEPTLELWFSRCFRDGGTATVARTTDMLKSTDPEGYARACELLSTVDTSDHLSRIARPALVLCADDDAPAFVAAAPALASRIDGSELRWLTGRHAVAAESPTDFAAAVDGFLTRIDRATPRGRRTP